MREDGVTETGELNFHYILRSVKQMFKLTVEEFKTVVEETKDMTFAVGDPSMEDTVAYARRCAILLVNHREEK